MPRRRAASLARHSFLRRADPRTKLVLSVAASLAVMLSFPQLLVFLACYVALISAAGLMRPMVTHLRRLCPFLILLFAFDWLFIGWGFAVLITLRLWLLVTAFTLLFATTTPEEVRQALERIGVPQRLAFTFATAYRSLELVETEWRGVLEAQRARGIVGQRSAERGWRQRLTSAVSLIVPAIVLITQRAWSMTEAAAARGVESPLRLPRHGLRLGRMDHLLLAGMAGLFLGLYAFQ
ncbi:MAG: energy-coupling factor transporter transmembrane component T family protein [Candidatus Binatia bacterium]